jgi:hypothetical protein
MVASAGEGKGDCGFGRPDRTRGGETMTYLLKLKEAKIRHADEIAQIEMEVNHQMGGDCDIAELVALLLMRGWTAPDTPAPTGTGEGVT